MKTAYFAGALCSFFIINHARAVFITHFVNKSDYPVTIYFPLWDEESEQHYNCPYILRPGEEQTVSEILNEEHPSVYKIPKAQAPFSKIQESSIETLQIKTTEVDQRGNQKNSLFFCIEGVYNYQGRVVGQGIWLERIRIPKNNKPQKNHPEGAIFILEERVAAYYAHLTINSRGFVELHRDSGPPGIPIDETSLSRST